MAQADTHRFVRSVLILGVLLLVLLGLSAPAAVAATAHAPVPAVRWGQRTPVSSPGPLAYAASAYDPATKQLIVFGGWNGEHFQAGTWAWNGTRWKELAKTGPSARDGASLAYDSATRQLVLFGGYHGTGYDGDTWVWSGTAWTDEKVAGPSRRDASALAYDPESKQLVLFGGYGATGTDDGDTWVWSGTTWAKIVSPTSPPARAWAQMGYDSLSSQLLLFGGYSTAGGESPSLGDTWLWTGTEWHQLHLSTSPPAVDGGELSYDPGLGGLVLFGGYSWSSFAGYPEAPLRETWLWDGRTWLKLAPAVSPPGRGAAAYGYDPLSRQLLVFGGMGTLRDGYGDGTVLSDTWTLVTPRLAIAPPTLPSGTVGTPYAATLTATGGTAPYSFRAMPKTLPTGISLSPAGQLSGTPAKQGNFAVTVVVEDHSGYFASTTYLVTISPPAG